MTLPGRFAEYGLSGAFFWICQLILLLLSDQIEATLDLFSTTPLYQVSAAPQLVQTLIVSLLAVLAIITVFTTGLLLDLCASFFVVWEISVFKQHLDRNSSWLSSLLEKYPDYCTDDYHKLRDHFGHGFFSKEAWLEGVRWCLFWQRGWWSHFLAMNRQVFGRPTLTKPHTRLWHFLMSYVMIRSGSSQLNMLTDLISQWKVGRALSTAMAITTTEIYLGMAIWPLTLSPSSLTISAFISKVSLLVLAAMAPFMLSVFVIYILYARVCDMLFSLAYVTKQKEIPL